MKKTISIIILTVVSSFHLYAQNKIEHFDIQSKYLDESRTINIALPQHYELSTKEYPIVLVLDNNLLFNITSAITNQLSATSRMPESIVVSIKEGSKHRAFYAPNLYSNTRNRPYGYGNHQEEFLQFIQNELIPQLDEKYRTVNYRTLIGFSPSSVLTLHSIWSRPNLFQAYITIASGNIIGDGYVKGESMIDKLEDLFESESNLQSYVYVVSGGKYFEGQHFIKINVSEFNKRLGKYNTKNIQTKAEIIEGEGHTDVALQGLISGFDFIYPKEKWIVDYLKLIEKPGSAKQNILDFYDTLSNSYGFKIYPNMDRLYSMSCIKNVGRRLLGSKKTEDAVELYEYWTELYPKSHVAYSFLGKSYKESSKNNSKAIEAFKKAYNLALNQNSSDKEIYKLELENLDISKNN